MKLLSTVDQNTYLENKEKLIKLLSEELRRFKMTYVLCDQNYLDEALKIIELIKKEGCLCQHSESHLKKS